MDIRKKIKLIVFSTETRAGRLFDMTLLWIIVFSILVIMLESVPALNAKYHGEFKILEWVFTILFTLEYLVRVWVVQKKTGLHMSCLIQFSFKRMNCLKFTRKYEKNTGYRQEIEHLLSTEKVVRERRKHKYQ